MLSFTRRLLDRHSTVVAYLALFVALGGTAYALKKDSVGSKQLKPEAVKTGDLANDAVTSPKVAPGTLQVSDFAEGQLPAGERGPEGPQGQQGERGPAGTARAYGVLNVSTCAGSPTICPPDRSSGVSEIRRVSTGVYCLTAPGVDSQNTPAVAEVEYNNSTPPEPASIAMFQRVPGTTVGCAASDFIIQTVRLNTVDVGGGQLVMDDTESFTNNTSFSFVIP